MSINNNRTFFFIWIFWLEDIRLAARKSFDKQSILWENFQRSSSRKHCFSSRIASPSFLISDESLFVKTHPFPFWLIQFDHFLIFKIEWSAREQTTLLFFFPYIFSQLYASTFHSFTLKVKVITSAELMPSPLPQYEITFPSDAAS